MDTKPRRTLEAVIYESINLVKSIMTREEAAEELLKDDPYVHCKTCAGYGYVQDLRVDWSMKECRDCYTAGRIVRRRYIQACVLLGTYPREFTRAVAEDQ